MRSDTDTHTICGLTCPRCNHKLFEHEPDSLWLRWFECLECLSAWHLVNGRLHAGKLRRPLGAA